MVSGPEPLTTENREPRTTNQLARVNSPNQPFILGFHQAEMPLPLIDSRRPVADSWDVARGSLTGGFCSRVGDFDLAALEYDLLLVEPLERTTQIPRIHGRPYRARRIGVECSERLFIASQCASDRGGT